jgi:acyl carrier protein
MSATVIAMINEILTTKYEIPAAELSETTVFEDVAVDSLALLEISLLLERQLGVPIAEGTLGGHQTIGQAAVAVGALLAPAP